MTDWLKERITERTSIDGLILVAVGVLALIAKPIIGLVAYAAIVYGVYTFCRSE
jgi:hypothetical protein|tara:strand:+ start:135 stop:296 length:162 start_codon:yes stop_codon:yes gene_type:complete